MTVSQELREWAMHDRYADTSNLTDPAWNEMAEWRRGEWGWEWDSWFDDHIHVRTFALLVACALEDE